MNAWVHLGFSYRFMHLRKLGLSFKTLISLKPKFLSKVPYAKRFKIGILFHLKTLPKCYKRKELKKIGFQGQNTKPVKALANRLNRLGNRLPLSGRGVPKTLSLI